MLHKETVENATLELIHRLMAEKELAQFKLVGGTALALMIGHRTSIDIDLFSETPFNTPEIAEILSGRYSVENLMTGTNSISCFLEDIKFDCMSHQYEWIAPTVEMEGIRMASVEDIAAMKLNAIVGNGTRYKDFVDIYFLLEYSPLEDLLSNYQEKYPKGTIDMALNSLLYFSDVRVPANLDLMNEEIEWEHIEERIIEASEDLGKVFEQKNDMRRNQSRGRKR